jgi:glycosyltransferase involved in cell wall biosynthesis
MNKNLLISVCIPTYSRLEYLQIAIDSILAQTYPHYEICVALDPKNTGPDSAIDTWCISYAKENSSFKYYVNPENVGLAGNWNVLANMASGAYVIIIGDDDTLEPDYLESVVGQIHITGADVVFSDQNFIGPTGEILEELTQEASIDYRRAHMSAGRLAEPIRDVLHSSVPMSAAIIKRDLLLKFPFDPILNTPELEVFLKIALDECVFAYVNSRKANYRVHEGSETTAGLRLHYMIKNIIALKVPEKYELLKYKLVSDAMIPAVNICLRQGDRDFARNLMNSGYYPSGKLHYKFIQSILLYLPNRIAKRIL